MPSGRNENSIAQDSVNKNVSAQGRGQATGYLRGPQDQQPRCEVALHHLNTNCFPFSTNTFISSTSHVMIHQPNPTKNHHVIFIFSSKVIQGMNQTIHWLCLFSSTPCNLPSRYCSSVRHHCPSCLLAVEIGETYICKPPYYPLCAAKSRGLPSVGTLHITQHFGFLAL